jgi:hypothetical protein
MGSATETLISANYRTAHETFYAAEAGLARAVSDLQRAADWSLALGGAVTSGLQFAGAPVAPDGRALDPSALTRRLQAESDAEAGADPDRPVWTLFGHGPLSRLLPDEGAVRGYLILWIADDPADGDGVPTFDANGRILVRCEAFGERGARRTVEAELVRATFPDGSIRSRVLSWRPLR